MTRNNHAPWDLADLSLRLHELAIHTGDLKHSCLGCGHEHNCGVHGCAVLLAAEDAVVKLKAYVDLGFEPEEYKRTMSSDIIVRCAAAALGVSVKQLCEVVALGKAGRVVVLPCKVGDRLYEVTGRKTISVYKVRAIRVELFGLFIEWDIVEGFVWQSLSGINAGEIGKTVFLTREEAEKALEAMKDE